MCRNSFLKHVIDGKTERTRIGERIKEAAGRPLGSETVADHATGNTRSQPPGEFALEEDNRAVVRPLAAAHDDDDDDDVGPNVMGQTAHFNSETKQQITIRNNIRLSSARSHHYTGIDVM